MSALPQAWLVRHGETAWSRSGQHTGRTDIPLTVEGEANGRRLARRLAGLDVGLVLVSPLARARRTCELAGFGSRAETCPDLLEWDYGRYEGRTSADIHRENPAWDLFRDGGPGGESPADVGARADRVVARLRSAPGNGLVFSSGHFLRVLAARWLGQPPAAARYFLLGTASVSVLGYEHTLEEPALQLWNDRGHLAG